MAAGEDGKGGGDGGDTSEDTYRVVVTPTPHPEWAPGQKQPLPFPEGTGMATYRPADLSSCYSLCISAVVPRPIAFVSSVSASGEVNLAPYSYAGVVAHDPPTVIFSACRKPGGARKDTLANVEATGEFVLNFMSEWFVESANHCCGNFPADVNEMEVSGLTPVASEAVRPPRVGESALQMECRVVHTREVRNAKGDVTATVVFGEVAVFHIHECIHTLDQGRIVVDLEKYRPISRLGGNTYGACRPRDCGRAGGRPRGCASRRAGAPLARAHRARPLTRARGR